MKASRILVAILISSFVHLSFLAFVTLRTKPDVEKIEVDWVEPVEKSAAKSAAKFAAPSAPTPSDDETKGHRETKPAASDSARPRSAELESAAGDVSGGTLPSDVVPDTATRLRDRWLKGEASGESNDSDPYSQVRSSGHGWSRGVQYGNSMDLAFTNETLGFFQALHQRVDGPLVYPDDFSRQRVSGRVHVEVEVGRDGRLLRLLGIEAENDLLQAYVLAYLIQVLQEPLPERVWIQGQRAVVVFDFDFRTRISGNTPATLVVGVQKNHLLFARESMILPWLNEKIEEVFTHYVPPIIPIPGGVYVDFVLAYKYVKNIIEDAPVESEARQARLDLLQKSLLQTIRKEKVRLDLRSTPVPDVQGS